MSKVRYILIVAAISVALAAATVLLIVFDPEYVLQDTAGKIASLVILPLWVFSVAPSYTYAACWIEDNLNFRQSFWLGYCLGLMFPLLIAPVLMVFYYVSAIENFIGRRVRK